MGKKVVKADIKLTQFKLAQNEQKVAREKRRLNELKKTAHGPGKKEVKAQKKAVAAKMAVKKAKMAGDSKTTKALKKEAKAAAKKAKAKGPRADEKKALKNLKKAVKSNNAVKVANAKAKIRSAEKRVDKHIEGSTATKSLSPAELENRAISIGRRAHMARLMYEHDKKLMDQAKKKLESYMHMSTPHAEDQLRLSKLKTDAKAEYDAKAAEVASMKASYMTLTRSAARHRVQAVANKVNGAKKGAASRAKAKMKEKSAEKKKVKAEAKIAKAQKDEQQNLKKK